MLNISKHTKASILNRIKMGDLIRYDKKYGEVVSIQILKHSTQNEYFCKLKNEGVILIIK